MRIWPEKTVDQEFADLGSAGWSGTLNDRQFAYLRNAGYTGGLADMMFQLRTAPPTPPAFTPASLFTAGVEGVWSSRISTADLWQDTARTTPVTAVGQSVASWRVNKASGVEYMEQGTAASRPIYRIDGNGVPYLEFDGGNDLLQSAGTFAISGSVESTMMVAVDFDGAYAENAGFLTYNIDTAVAGLHRAIGMTAAGGMKVDVVNFSTSAPTIPTTFAVLEGRIGGSSISAAINGGSFTTTTGTINTATGKPLVIGRGITPTFANHKCYGILFVVKAITMQERSNLVAWMTALGNP